MAASTTSACCCGTAASKDEVTPHAEPRPTDIVQAVVAGVDDDRDNITHVRNRVGGDDGSDNGEDDAKAVSTTVSGGGG